MPSNYVPQQRARSPLVLPVDGDNFDAEALNVPLRSAADMARYAIAAYGANLRAERPKPSAESGYYLYGVGGGPVNVGAQLIAVVVCGAPEGGNALACVHVPGGGWQELAVPFNTTMFAVCHDPVIGWTMVGAQTGTAAAICTAPQEELPLTWTARSNPSNLPLVDCASDGDGTVVAVGGSGSSAYIVRTVDNVVFSAQASPVGGALTRVIYAGGVWVAAGETAGGGPLILRSTNGETWLECSVSGASDPVAGLAYTGSGFVAVTTSGQIAKSADGVSWSSDGVSKLGSGFLRGFAADPVSGTILAQCGGAPRGYGIAVSYDGGDTWDEFPALGHSQGPGVVQLWRAAFIGRRFYGVGTDSHVAVGLAR